MSPTTPAAKVPKPIGPRQGSGIPNCARGAKQAAVEVEVAAVVVEDVFDVPELVELDPELLLPDAGAAETENEIIGALTPPTLHCSVQFPICPVPIVPVNEKLPFASVAPEGVVPSDVPFCVAVSDTAEFGAPLMVSFQESPT